MMVKLSKAGKKSRAKNLYLRIFESSVFQFSTKSVFLGAFFCVILSFLPVIFYQSK